MVHSTCALQANDLCLEVPFTIIKGVLAYATKAEYTERMFVSWRVIEYVTPMTVVEFF